MVCSTFKKLNITNGNVGSTVSLNRPVSCY